MGNRLKEIWSGFEGTTDCRLTGKGVENIVVPHRADFDANEAQFLPQDFESPAERAFASLRADLASKEKKFAKAKRRDKVGFDADDIAPTDTGAYGGEALATSLKSTAIRVERAELDYGAFMQSDAGKKALKRTKKKKRFGIF